jgi:1-acyl-sn-glycerol-3-phosphate acyltransferase
MATVVFMACYIPPAVFRWLTRHRCTVDDAQCTADEARCTVASKLPITLERVVRSLFAMGFFLVMMYLFLLPYTWLRFHLCQMTDERRIGYHRLLQRMAAFVIRHVPGVSFHLDNSVGETFRQPSVIIANHQSHLDLMCLMMLTPRLVFLTNDWVWHNPFYGMVIHRAEFVPVSDGIEANIDRLRALYRRGYSICVFPEGTRSADCSIQRFHQGAFYLARQLGADILPVYLHGPGHVLPKRDFLLRPGRIDVEVGHRLTVDEPLLAFTRSMRHHYQSHYAALCQRIETPAYWRPYRHLLNYYKSPHIR